MTRTGQAVTDHQKSTSKMSPIKIVSVAFGVGLLSACMTPAAAPPPPPPPAPVVETIPARPLPPRGAAYVMQIPSKNALGQRETVNLGVSDDERVWHFRSAWNVAGLNCVSDQYAPIVTAYSAYISDHKRELKAINDRIDRVYRRENGGRRSGIRAREAQMTSVYNFFALPPARAGFCAAVLDVSNRYLLAPVDPVDFANSNFGVLEQAFEQFFLDYEKYQRDSAAWDMKYGEQYGPSQPGWLAVQDAKRNGIPIPTAGESNPVTTLADTTTASGSVADPQTGAEVPVVPTQTEFVSQPVVEPVATGDTNASDGGSQ